MQLDKKVELISEHMSQVKVMDLFSETYRGGQNHKLYAPLSYKKILSEWKNFIKNNPESDIDVYIHIPFCLKICHYCNYYKELAGGKDIDSYIELYMIPYIQELAKLFKGHKMNSLYIGGGTPSVLSKKLLGKLLQEVSNGFDFKPNAEKSFEGNPVSLSTDKIHILKKYGINRVSMGVQTLNDSTLELANREYQSEKIISKVITDLDEVGIQDVNIDLLIGLDDNEKDDFFYSLKYFSKMPINCITVYWLTPTPKYLEKYFKHNIGDFYTNLHTQIETIHDGLLECVDTFGFDSYDFDKCSNHCWNFMVKTYSKNTSYTDVGGNSLLGIGPSARSYIHGKLVYATLGYVPSAFDTTLVDNTGIIISEMDEFLLNILIDIRDKGYLDMRELSEKYGFKIEEKYHQELAYIIDQGYAHIEGDKLQVTELISGKFVSALLFFPLTKLSQKKIIDGGNHNNQLLRITHGGLGIKMTAIFSDKEGYTIIFDEGSITIKNISIIYSLYEMIQKLLTSEGQEEFKCKKIYAALHNAFGKKFEVSLINVY